MNKLPKHLAELNLEEWKIKALYYLFRAR